MGVAVRQRLLASADLVSWGRYRVDGSDGWAGGLLRVCGRV
jgi:hypothetical protein